MLRAWKQLGDTNGSLLASALTFMSFLALFPMILLGVAITGYVLASREDLRQKLLDNIASQAPGGFGEQIRTAITTATNARASIGIIALVSVAFTGLGWVANLRQATEQVWGHLQFKRSFLAAKLADAVVLVGLGLGLIVSVVLTAVGSSLTGETLHLLHLRRRDRRHRPGQGPGHRGRRGCRHADLRLPAGPAAQG